MDDKCTTCLYKTTIQAVSKLAAVPARCDGKSTQRILEAVDTVRQIRKEALDRFETMLIEKAKWKTSGNQNGICVSDIVKLKIQLMKEFGYE